MIRYPRPLTPGDTIGITCPSLGVPDDLRPRLDVAIEHLHALGYEVLLGEALDGSGIASAPVHVRAAELTALLTDPSVRAVVPPWGGEIAVDLLARLDWQRLAEDPTWFVGYSDISTLLLPLTLMTGVATLHGQNLLDTPYRVPEPQRAWTEVVTAPPGASIEQGPARRYRSGGFDRWQDDPAVDTYTLDAPGGWTRVDDKPTAPVDVVGRLVGGCLETVSHLAGTPFGDVEEFASTHAPEGLVVYLESAGSDVGDVTRRLVGLRNAGWFRHATAIRIGRPRGPERHDFTHQDAARHAVGDLGVPVLADVDCGHVPPHLALVNGALAHVRHDRDESGIVQRLVP